MVRIPLTCLLFYYFYKGRNWARTLSIVFTILGLSVSVISSLYFLAFGYQLAALTMMVVGVPDIVILILFVAKPVKSYMRYVNPEFDKQEY